MSKGNTYENDLLKLLFNATAIANVADNAASSPLTQLFLALHTADPGEAGAQNTSEIAYTSYARVAVNRNSGGFTVSGNQVTLTANTDFPAGTGGGGTALFFSVGKAVSGAGEIFYSGPLGSSMGLFVGATSDTITIPGLTGLAVDDRIAFFAAPGSALPTGIAEGTVYWVKTLSGADITVSATQGGAAIDITAVGAGAAYRITPVICGDGITPRLTTGTTITED